MRPGVPHSRRAFDGLKKEHTLIFLIVWFSFLFIFAANLIPFVFMVLFFNLVDEKNTSESTMHEYEI